MFPAALGGRRLIEDKSKNHARVVFSMVIKILKNILNQEKCNESLYIENELIFGKR